MSESVEVFLSHSSKDLMLAEAVVELLTSSIDLLGVVRCTSAFGYSLDIGTGVARKLRKEIDECDVFLTLISVNSLSSQFCLFEMGAAWGLKKKIKPILAPNFSHVSRPDRAWAVCDGAALSCKLVPRPELCLLFLWSAAPRRCGCNAGLAPAATAAA